MSTQRPPPLNAHWSDFKPIEGRRERLNSLHVDIARMKELAAASNVPFRTQFLELAGEIERYVKRLEASWGTRPDPG